MNINLDVALLMTALLVAVRFGALMLLSPIFASMRMPVQIRVLFILGLAFTMLLGLGVKPIAVPESVVDLVSMAARELVMGGLLAFGVFTAFAVFSFGGRILDFQMGFGVANLVDPVTNTPSPLIGTVLNYMAVAAFFVVNGHHALIRGFALSLEKFPPGTGVFEINVSAMVAQFGVMFLYGLAIVMPTVMALLFIDIGMAVAARTMPQVNMFIVGIPVKVFVGLSVLAVTVDYLAPLLEKVYGSIFLFWEEILE